MLLLRLLPPNMLLLVSMKLDINNHLLWKQQVVAIISGHNLLHFLDGSKPIPHQFLSNQDRKSRQINTKFVEWQQQDSLLVLWLLSYMTESVLTRLVGLISISQLKPMLRSHSSKPYYRILRKVCWLCMITYSKSRIVWIS